ncbi:MAG: (R)-phenoxypropionate/alpha-ketoglutarate-dioxygenase [Alphaproteobacteria bacterium MarineAlpha4_Bin2]|nr:MAG: (R)-phenoxypropionate/alpha-ketoglutarate-dioxygenase [Alphaproteobacteria bacterium MarineAlpha4_Bin2]
MSAVPQKRVPTRIGVRPASGAFGAEITGVDLSKSLDDEIFSEIEQAFFDHGVIFFRNQAIKPEHQVTFTERFGAIEPHPLGSRRGLDGNPEVMVLENWPGKLGPRNDFWHSDISFGEVPPALSMLYAIEGTEGRADTMFANMYAAYEELSAPLKDFLASLKAEHNAEDLVNEVPSRVKVTDVPPGVIHPVVRTHPGSRRKALFVNPYYTSHFIGMTIEESQPILNYIYARATRHENIYRHTWRKGDVLMWDNRCTMHYAVRDYDENMPRYLHRTTAAGERPE